MAFLEDPHHRAERRGQAEHVEHERLHGDEQAAEHHEQQHERRHRDEQRRRAASGRTSEDFVSTSWADGSADEPVERAGRRRMSWASASPAAETGSTDGTTLSQVPRAPANRCVAAPGGGIGWPPA